MKKFIFIITLIFITSFSKIVFAQVSDDNFIFNCPNAGTFTVPNQQKSIVRFDLEYMPSFTEDKVILESDNQNILIDLKSGALFVDGNEYDKCEILAVPKTKDENIIISNKNTLSDKVHSLEIGCLLREHHIGDFPVIEIWSVKSRPGSYDPNEYAQSGIMSVSVEISGKGKTISLEGSFPYRKIGNRIEGLGLPHPGNPAINYITMEEFKENFGLFPTVTCTAP